MLRARPAFPAAFPPGRTRLAGSRWHSNPTVGQGPIRRDREVRTAYCAANAFRDRERVACEIEALRIHRPRHERGLPEEKQMAEPVISGRKCVSQATAPRHFR
jgi:hypothetical protein